MVWRVNDGKNFAGQGQARATREAFLLSQKILMVVFVDFCMPHIKSFDKVLG